MNTKLVASAIGLTMLGASAVALADGWDRYDHDRRGYDRGPAFHSWHDDARDRADRHWHEYRWYRAEPRAYVQPAPHWHPYTPYAWAPRPYQQDGLTIILRGHVN